MDLAIVLAKLNAVIDTFNADLEEAVEQGVVTPEKALTLRVAPGSATFEMVHAETHSLAFARAVEESLIEESPQEIIRLAKSVKQPTQITRQMCFGSAKAPKKTRAVLVKTIQLAHLLSRAAG